jgi:hypothetical protein
MKCDPKFAYLTINDHNLHLASDSPCIDAGDDTDIGSTEVDIDAEARVDVTKNTNDNFFISRSRNNKNISYAIVPKIALNFNYRITDGFEIAKKSFSITNLSFKKRLRMVASQGEF